jgi:hypothetical protein
MTEADAGKGGAVSLGGAESATPLLINEIKMITEHKEILTCFQVSSWSEKALEVFPK